MLTSGERAELRSMATAIKPIFQIGKGGFSDHQVADVVCALEAHELIKITVLKTADYTAKEAVDILAKLTLSEPVTAIGNKFVLYKRSTRGDVKHIF